MNSETSIFNSDDIRTSIAIDVEPLSIIAESCCGFIPSRSDSSTWLIDSFKQACLIDFLRFISIPFVCFDNHRLKMKVSEFIALGEKK